MTRQPYLQLAAPTAVTVALRTATPTTMVVRFSVRGASTSRSVTSFAPAETHELRLTGLQPAMQYDYQVDIDGQTIASGPDFTFRTPPLPGTLEAFRLFAWGDSGTGTSSQIAVANRMANELNGAALSLILGDIIYPSGAPQDYDPKFFRPYQRLLARQVVWPVIGNHDSDYDGLGRPWADAFVTPANNPSNDELYYSFDWGNAHFVVLDTHVNAFRPGSAQMTWAAADLAASTATWKIAAFHVPPYTGGTHADNAAVQAGIVPILESAGVDFVFAGHSHVYERTFLLSQNTILQNTPTSYVKGPSNQGTLYIVSGTAGQSGGLSNPQHPLMAVQIGNVLGTAVVDFNGPTAHGYFLESTGAVRDLFRISKGPDTLPPSLVAARATSDTQVEVTFDEPVADVERPQMWRITPLVMVTAADLQPNQRTVLLTTTPHDTGTYQVAVIQAPDTATPRNRSDSQVWYEVTPFDGGSFDGGSFDAGTFDGGEPLIDGRSTLRAWVGTSTPPASWRLTAFDDSAWVSGPLPVGYGEPGLGTTVAMGDAVTLYSRMEFDFLGSVNDIQNLFLEIDYDDGFVAFLNGHEVARRGVPAGETHQTLAVSHESGAAERFTLADAGPLVLSGNNMLAIEVHNSDVTSSDLFLNVRLWANAVAPLTDAGVTENDDAGLVDAGLVDAGPGLVDAGTASTQDAGTPTDAGHPFDAGRPRRDAGIFPPDSPPRGCGCNASPFLALVILLAIPRRRHERR